MPDKPQDKYPRITQAQFDLWADSPVTKALLACINWASEDAKDVLAGGKLVDPANNDLTCSNIHKLTGYRNGLAMAGDFNALFTEYELLEAEDA